LALNFSNTTGVVIALYCVTDSSNSEETDFLSTEDKFILDYSRGLATENTNIEYMKKKCKTAQQILEVLEQDLAHYSTAIVGNNTLDYFPLNNSERELVTGNVASFIEQQHMVNLMVVNKSKRRPKYPLMPPISSRESLLS